MRAMLQSMGKGVLKPFGLVAAAVLALSMLLSACGAFDEHASASQLMFTRMDRNRDGWLSKREFDAGHARPMKAIIPR